MGTTAQVATAATEQLRNSAVTSPQLTSETVLFGSYAQ